MTSMAHEVVQLLVGSNAHTSVAGSPEIVRVGAPRVFLVIVGGVFCRGNYIYIYIYIIFSRFSDDFRPNLAPKPL